MNLAHSIQLLSRLPVRHRDSGNMVDFQLNPNQQRLMERISAQYERDRKVRVIILKARRVGMSSLTEGLLFCHCLAYSNRHAKIVSHMSSSSEELFRVPRDLAFGCPFGFRTEDIQSRRIYFRHEDGDSKLTIATAGTPGAGRGETLSALHLSEAAKYEQEESFLSMLPAVGFGDDTLVCIESTANGTEGPGEPFADFWEDAEAGKNGYEPVFLSWLDDPACVRPAAEAKDAPLNRLETELMKHFSATRAQIAWMRRTRADQCRDLEPLWLQEYPHTAEVAFQVTGDPAFPPEETDYVRTTLKDPTARGTLRRNTDGRGYTFEENSRGSLHLWERPQPNDWYYIGADAALGKDEGDFSAYCVLNGTTGEMVARLADLIHPEILADQLDMAGRWYNLAKINIELTGNLGRWTQSDLRDRFHYPNLHQWKGKDDRKPGRGKNVLLGWDTNMYSRPQMFNAFRIALRAGIQSMPGGLVIRDKALYSQMVHATTREGWSFEVHYGHDDILFAALLAVVSCAHYPPPKTKLRNRKPEPDKEIQGLPPAVPDVAYELQRHWKELNLGREKRRSRTLYKEA
jgi:hypothetical protein